MDPKEFYGPEKSNKSGLINRINHIWEAGAVQRKKRPHHIFQPFTSSLLGPTVVWLTFPRQIEALDYCQTAGKDVHIFAYESDTLLEGKRRYLVTSYEHFWHAYSQLDLHMKHHYEVIREGDPVKLYFDLEFSQEFNAERNGVEMVDFLLLEMDLVFEELYGNPLPSQDMVQLDASTPAKFSQHLVFPSVIFQTVSHAGMFVSSLCHRFLSRKSSETLENSTARPSVKNKDGEDILFIDQSVYTKNRNFRLYQSCKLGRNNPLLLTPDCPLQEKTPREIFFLSLICNVGAIPETAVLTFDLEKNPLPGLAKPKFFRNAGLSQIGYSQSPFPEVDAFFQSIITADGQHGRIRQWQYFPDTHTITYAIAGDYKYCARVGRHHRSNNILFVARLLKGTYHQKCLDSDCRLVDFSSPDYFLPVQLVISADTDPRVMNEVFSGVFDVEGDEVIAGIPLDG